MDNGKYLLLLIYLVPANPYCNKLTNPPLFYWKFSNHVQD